MRLTTLLLVAITLFPMTARAEDYEDESTAEAIREQTEVMRESQALELQRYEDERSARWRAEEREERREQHERYLESTQWMEDSEMFGSKKNRR